MHYDLLSGLSGFSFNSSMAKTQSSKVMDIGNPEPGFKYKTVLFPGWFSDKGVLHN